MPKKASLADVFAPKPDPIGPATHTSAEIHGYRAPSRRGRKALTVYLDPAAHRQMRLLGLEQGRSGQDLVVEALNDLFRKNGKPPIAS